MTIAAGRLRHRITLQRPVTVPDEYGQPVPSWEDVAVVWAAVDPVMGREFYAAQQIRAEQPVRVRIRHRSDVGPTWRVIHDGRVLEIEAVQNPGEIGAELILMCREVVA